MRDTLYTAASEHLGEPAAEALMALLPPIDPDEIARRSDIARVEARLDQTDAARRADIALIGARLDGLVERFVGIDYRFEGINHRLDTIITKLEIRTSKLVLAYLGATIPMMLTVAGLVLAVVKLA